MVLSSLEYVGLEMEMGFHLYGQIVIRYFNALIYPIRWVLMIQMTVETTHPFLKNQALRRFLLLNFLNRDFFGISDTFFAG